MSAETIFRFNPVMKLEPSMAFSVNFRLPTSERTVFLGNKVFKFLYINRTDTHFCEWLSLEEFYHLTIWLFGNINGKTIYIEFFLETIYLSRSYPIWLSLYIEFYVSSTFNFFIPGEYIFASWNDKMVRKLNRYILTLLHSYTMWRLDCETVSCWVYCKLAP